MNDENLTELFSFESKINGDGTIRLPDGKFRELAEAGFEEVKIIVLGDAGKSAVMQNMNTELFSKIKELQALPENIVLGFLNSKGSLKNSGFEKRIKY